jgi:hypothetical protein
MTAAVRSDYAAVPTRDLRRRSPDPRRAQSLRSANRMAAPSKSPVMTATAHQASNNQPHHST